MPPLQPEKLGAFERSYCDCDKCKAACHTMPGMLAPGDMAYIAVHQGVEPGDLDWTAANFEASPGAMVQMEGLLGRIPTIVPAQRPDGRCVFLTDDDRCGIHKVAPFGCRCFNVCDGPESHEDAVRSSSAALACCAGDLDYIQVWAWLKSVGSTATPTNQRRSALRRKLDEIDT